MAKSINDFSLGDPITSHNMMSNGNMELDKGFAPHFFTGTTCSSVIFLHALTQTINLFICTFHHQNKFLEKLRLRILLDTYNRLLT